DILSAISTWWIPPAAMAALEQRPAWLADLAEAVGRQRIGSSDQLTFADSPTFLAVKSRIMLWRQNAPPDAHWADWVDHSFAPEEGLAQRRVHPGTGANATIARITERLGKADRRELQLEALELGGSLPTVLEKLVREAFRSRWVFELESNLPQTAMHAASWYRQDPDNAEAAISFAACLSAMGHVPAARRVMESVDASLLSGTLALLTRARVEAATGAFADACTSYGAAFEAPGDPLELDGFRREALLERRALRVRTDDSGLAVAEFLDARGIPPRPAQAPVTCIDLSAHYTAALDESWHGAQWDGQNLGPLPRGIQTLDDVAFDLRGIVQLSGLSVDRYAPGYPDAASGISVGMPVRELHFLHALGWGQYAHTESRVASYVVHFADGSTETIPLVNGRDIYEWGIQIDRSELHEGVSIAWEGVNARGSHIKLFRKMWRNPKPEIAIESIDFVSTGTNAAPFLVALTATPPLAGKEN
ncbi:MAG: hypothetical protein KDN22_25860, partial [Verrucomicrobiae bacterium]|nr:hypothetical protein [Verrucomicrobiae bacterium]